MRTTSKQQPSNERAMSIAGSPVYEKRLQNSRFTSQ